MNSIEQLGNRVTICYGPTMEETSRNPMGVKWCFKCRSRNEFDWVVMSPVIDWNDEASIYAAGARQLTPNVATANGMLANSFPDGRTWR